jgi:uncharacterized protein YlbG (UPF0298 family)
VSPNNPLEQKRKEKEDKLIQIYLTEENFEKDGIELQSTLFLHETAESIYEELLREFMNEASFFFN